MANILKEKALRLGSAKHLSAGSAGMAPKVLLVFRIGGDMRKLTTPKYVDPVRE